MSLLELKTVPQIWEHALEKTSCAQTHLSFSSSISWLVKGIASPNKSFFIYCLRQSQLQQHYQTIRLNKHNQSFLYRNILGSQKYIVKMYRVNSMKKFLRVLHCCISIALPGERPVKLLGHPECWGPGLRQEEFQSWRVAGSWCHCHFFQSTRNQLSLADRPN